MESCVKVLRKAYVGKRLIALEWGANGPNSPRTFAQGVIITDVVIGNGEILLYFNEWGRSFVKVDPSETIIVSD